MLLSEWDDETVERWSRTFAPGPDAAGKLPAKLARIRRCGYETVDEEFEPGLVGVSAPVHGFRGDVVAAVNVSAPKARLGGRLPAAGRFARTVADRISGVLGAPR